MGQADLVLRNASVITVDPARDGATAVALADGRIVAVGDDPDVADAIGPSTRVVDLGGRTLMPGFQDAHCHPPIGGLNRMRCDLSACATPQEVFDTIAAFVRRNPDVPWIRGGAWHHAMFGDRQPTAADLDRVTDGRPALLPNADGHQEWVNTAALRLAGIDAATPDPSDGRIERGPHGEPTGILHEGAMSLVEDLAPPAGADEVLAAVEWAQAEFHRMGITAWHDAACAVPRWGDSYEAYRTMDAAGRLTMRTLGALWWYPEGDASQIERMRDLRAGGTGRFRPTAVKIMVDGTLDSFTAPVLESYLDRDGRPTGNHGTWYVPPDDLRRFITMLDADGFQVHLHTIGDAAIRAGLDAFEAAQAANGPNDLRHTMAHLQLLHPDDIPRFGALGVVANVSPAWGCHDPQYDELTIPFLGPERGERIYLYGSLLRAGAPMAFGSDWNVSTADPFVQLEVVTTRIPTEDRSLEPFLPHERLTLDQAIHTFTMGSAFVNHLDEVTSSITPGKLADLVIVDRDLRDGGAGPIGDAHAVATLVDGQVVATDGTVAL